MSEQTSFSLSFTADNMAPILTVTKSVTYRAKGPLTFTTNAFQEGVWYMDDGSGFNELQPTCKTVEEMLERGWIEEVEE